MSLAIGIKSPEGIVLAADSRVTLQWPAQPNTVVPVTYDTATKLLKFGAPNTHVGMVTFGQAVVPGPNRTAASFIPEFEAQQASGRQTLTTRPTVREVASDFAAFLNEHWKPLSGVVPDEMRFIVGGFDDGDAYGKLYTFSVPGHLTPAEQSANDFGMQWGGQSEIVARLVNGYSPTLIGAARESLGLTDEQVVRLEAALQGERANLPWGFLPLQDCVDLAALLMNATVGMQKLSIMLRGVGGPVDMVTVTRVEGVRVLNWKEVEFKG